MLTIGQITLWKYDCKKYLDQLAAMIVFLKMKAQEQANEQEI